MTEFCPKCDGLLREGPMVHCEAEGGTIQVTTVPIYCERCGYTEDRVTRRKLPAWLGEANKEAKQEMERRFGGGPM